MRKAKIIGIFLWPIFCNKKATPTSVATLVIRVRFEPTTHSLEDCCSIQLSYQTICMFVCPQQNINYYREYPFKMQGIF
jgi:hypothetical protein